MTANPDPKAFAMRDASALPIVCLRACVVRRDNRPDRMCEMDRLTARRRALNRIERDPAARQAVQQRAGSLEMASGAPVLIPATSSAAGLRSRSLRTIGMIPGGGPSNRTGR